MLNAHKLCAWHSPSQPLFQDLSFALTPGQCLYLQGPNGRGKTTLLRILCGLRPPEGGQITWQSQSIAQNRRVYLSNLLYVGHQPSLTSHLTVLENLESMAGFHGHSLSQAKILSTLQTLGLAHLTHRFVKGLSAGQIRRVALAKFTLIPAPLWILDEPFTTLDERACQQLEAQLSHHLQGGGMVVMTSHQNRPWLERAIPLSLGVYQS